jgi:hypothetical protein
MSITRSTWSTEQILDSESAADLALSPSEAAAQADAQWLRIERDILAMRRLQDDWDGEGADAPRSSVVESAVGLLRDLRDADGAPPVRATASPDGSVIIEWQSPGEYLEAEISKPYHVEWMHKRAGGPVQHWTDRRPLPRRRREDPCQIESEISEGYLVLAY